MSLPGVKPEVREPRLRIHLFGDYKVGKTTAAAQFPQNYFIDMERGAQQEEYVKLLRKADALYLETNEFDQVLTAVKALLSEDHDRRTLVIDPVTVLYTDLVEEGERLKGDEWGKHYGYANTRMKRLLLLLDRLDMNVIMTSHAKPEYVAVGGDKREATGKLTPDGYSKINYAFDLILELRKIGQKRRAEVRGSRLSSFPEGDIFDWSYDEFVKRLGHERLERKAEAVELATQEDVRELRRLMAEAQVTDEEAAKWLKKARVTEWEDAPADIVAKAAEHLQKRLDAAQPK